MCPFVKPLCVLRGKKKEINHQEHKGFHKEHKEKMIKMKKSRENNGIKNQIMLPKAMPLGWDMLPKAMPLGWVMLPFQGENGLPFFLTQGDAIGLGYAAPSGRKWNAVLSALKGQNTLAQRQRLGHKWNANFSALKGQYNPAQRQRLG